MPENPVHIVGEYKHFAQEQRRSGNLAVAGAYYIATAHGNLMRFRRQPSTIDDESIEDIIDEEQSPLDSPWFRWPTGLGKGMRYMIAGGLCFRLADKMDRCRACCTQGMALLQYVLNHEGAGIASPRIGLYHEMVGDLKLVGELGDHEASYDAARERYRNAESDLGWSMEDDFDDLMYIVLELAESVDYGISADTREQIYRTSLEERIRFKRNHYPQIIERVVEAGNWDSEVF